MSPSTNTEHDPFGALETEASADSVALPKRERRAPAPDGETSREQEKREAMSEKTEAADARDGAVSASRPPAPVKHVPPDGKTPERVAIEHILEAGLMDLYWSMPPARQVRFRKEGEATARKIESLLDKASIHFAKIVKLIRSWLALIPGVNSFFLEQEAKVKTDKILQMHEERKRRSQSVSS